LLCSKTQCCPYNLYYGDEMMTEVAFSKTWVTSFELQQLLSSARLITNKGEKIVC